MDHEEHKSEESTALYYDVYKSNEMIRRSRYSLTLREQRALDYAISKIQPNDKPGKEYKVKFQEACQVVNALDSVSSLGGAQYNAAFDFFGELVTREILIYPKGGGRTRCTWFTKVHQDENGDISFQFNEELAPYLFELRKNYTKYQLAYTVRMKSIYGPRLYQILRSHCVKGRTIEKSFTLSELRKEIGADFVSVKNRKGEYETRSLKSYDTYGKLKQAVIAPAINDINEYTDIFVSYTETKTGRKVTGVKFKIKDVTNERSIQMWEQIDKERHPERY